MRIENFLENNTFKVSDLSAPRKSWHQTLAPTPTADAPHQTIVKRCHFASDALS
jgi:hypothetical protein